MWFTWIVGLQPNGRPSIAWNSNSILQRRINKIILDRVPFPVEVSGPHSNHVEAVAVQVHRVIYPITKISTLEHNLHCCIILQHCNFCAILRCPVDARDILRGVVESQRWVSREVFIVDSWNLIVVRSKNVDSRLNERDVVDARLQLLASHLPGTSRARKCVD